MHLPPLLAKYLFVWPTNGQVGGHVVREPLSSEPALLHEGVHSKWLESERVFASSRDSVVATSSGVYENSREIMF